MDRLDGNKIVKQFETEVFRSWDDIGRSGEESTRMGVEKPVLLIILALTCPLFGKSFHF